MAYSAIGQCEHTRPSAASPQPTSEVHGFRLIPGVSNWSLAAITMAGQLTDFVDGHDTSRTRAGSSVALLFGR